MDGALPRGLLVLTLGVAVGIVNMEGDLGRGMLAGDICEIKVSIIQYRLVRTYRSQSGCPVRRQEGWLSWNILQNRFLKKRPVVEDLRAQSDGRSRRN